MCSYDKVIITIAEGYIRKNITHFQPSVLLPVLLTHNNTDGKKHHDIFLASFPGPTQLSVAFSTEKWERAWYLFSREIRQDRKDGRKDLIVCGRAGLRTAKAANVAGKCSHFDTD